MFARTLRAAVGLVALVLATQTFVAIGWLRPVVVSGASMTPQHQPGDRLLVRRWASPRRGDVVVLRSPLDARELLVKRVLGLPGERVTLREGAVWINGQEARNPSGSTSVYYGALGHPEWRLGADAWFVAGDRQAVSIDSRNWRHAAGAPGRLLVGVVMD